MSKKATAQPATTQEPEATTKAPVFVIKQSAAGHVYVEKHDEKPEGADITNCFSSELAAYQEIRQRQKTPVVTEEETEMVEQAMTGSTDAAMEAKPSVPFENVVKANAL